MSAENLMRVFSQSIPSERSIAMDSYFHYHRLTRSIALETGFTVEQACGVFSALSPNNDYIGNLKDCRRLLKMKAAGAALDDFKVTTYGNNKRKAWSIAGGTSVSEAIKAPKTWNFFNNLATPESDKFVTIDGHMYWAWVGRAGNVTGDRKTGIGAKVKPGAGAKVTSRTYKEIASDCRALAKALGILPNQFQAVCWVTWKRMHNKKHSAQTEFFPSDEVAAGVIRL